MNITSDKLIRWGNMVPYAPTFWRPRVCQFIEDEPSSDDACKCGEPAVPQFSYCQIHLPRMYRPHVLEPREASCR